MCWWTTGSKSFCRKVVSSLITLTNTQLKNSEWHKIKLTTTLVTDKHWLPCCFVIVVIIVCKWLWVSVSVSICVCAKIDRFLTDRKKELLLMYFCLRKKYSKKKASKCATKKSRKRKETKTERHKEKLEFNWLTDWLNYKDRKIILFCANNS